MIKNHWPTPIYSSKTSTDVCFELAQELMINYDFKSNVFDLQNELVEDFKNTVVIPAFNSFLRHSLDKEINDWKSHKLNGWVVSYNQDTSLNYHNHKGSQVSGVFYLMCEDNAVGGNITFTDPRHNANRGYDPSFNKWFDHLTVTPTSGDIMIFPSFLYHSVSTYKSNVRIALPVDLFLHTNT